jgi:hypothetical protein
MKRNEKLTPAFGAEPSDMELLILNNSLKILAIFSMA